MQSETTGTASVGKELLIDGKSIGQTAVDRLHTEADARKSAGVGQAKAAADALQQTAGNLDDQAPAWLRSALEEGSKQIQALANSLEQKDSRQLVSDVNEFARHSPGTFLAACGAAGFAAARIFKAGSNSRTTQDNPENDVASNGTDMSSAMMDEPKSGFGISNSEQFAAPAMAGATGGGL